MRLESNRGETILDMPEPKTQPLSASSEAELRAEIEELKRLVDEQARLLAGGATAHAAPAYRPSTARPSSGKLWILGLVTALIAAGAFFIGYIPHARRQSMLVAEAKVESDAIPTVNVALAERSTQRSELVLPGNIQAVTEAPLLARANGYVKRRYVDIGDRAKEGQLLAEIEAPEVDQQVRQARASLEEARSSLEQANANLEQGKANEQLSRVTARRYDSLVQRGAVSRQDNDTYQSQYQSHQASVRALEKAVGAARSSAAAAEANVARLTEMQGYLKVRAPFTGVITLRNVDVGALVTEGSTLLFRIAQTDRLRTYINLPQADAPSVHVGQPARLTLPDVPDRQFAGAVTRTANALDPSTRTLLTEVQVPNPTGILMPGMYAQVDLQTPRADPPLLIPGDTLVIRSDGPQVAVVNADRKVHFQHVQIGRDLGDRVEVIGGLQAGQQVIVNPGDRVREQVSVNPVLLHERNTPEELPAAPRKRRR